MRKLPPKATKNSILAESEASKEKPTNDNGKSKDTKIIKTDKAIINKHEVKSEDSISNHSENSSKEFAKTKSAKDKENPPNVLKLKTQSLSDYENKSVKTSMIKVSVSADSIKKEKDLSQAHPKQVNTSPSELSKTKNAFTEFEIIKSVDHVKPMNTKKGKL